MTSATWFDARMWRMRAAETRALAEDMKETEPKADHAEDRRGL
jgi:hypothetical protein